ncbi:MAG: hypothetical protein CVT84_05530 [Alphaproteobacteria bacterium HGW-Alphaproteobacteria-6]|nr:MAG: hypothetical protein CVT84_05530 [Alphaproteobacteria bacterium HGW-Alphaproteobacteria-6]
MRAASSDIDALLAEAARIAGALHLPAPQTLTQTLTGISALAAGLKALAVQPDGAAPLIPILFDQADQARLHEGLAAGLAWSSG